MSSPPPTLWRQLEALRQRKKMILLSALFCGLTAGVFSLLQRKTYSATTHLLVSESKISDSGSGQTLVSLAPLSHIYYELLRSYEVFISNDYLIQKTVEHFQLHRPPYELTSDKFKHQRMLQVKLSKNTRLLEVTVEFPDARLAADIANYFAANAAAFNEDLSARDTQRTREFLKQQLNQAQAAMERSSQLLLEFSQTARLEELRESVRYLLEEGSQNESHLVQLNTDLSRTTAKHVALTGELKKRDPAIELKENLAGKSPLSTNSAQNTPLPPDGLVKEQSLNLVNQQLQSRLVEADVEILSLKAGIEFVRKTAESTSQKLAALLREKASKESILERLMQEHQLARDNYAALNRKYQDASISVSARSTDLKVIAPAVVPDSPVKPRILLNTMLAVALGLIASSLLILLQNQWRLANSPAGSSSDAGAGAEDKIKEIKRSAKGFS